MKNKKARKMFANMLYTLLWRVTLYIPVIGFVFGVVGRIKDGREKIEGKVIEFIFGWYHLWAAPILGAALYQHYFIHPIPLF